MLPRICGSSVSKQSLCWIRPEILLLHFVVFLSNLILTLSQNTNFAFQNFSSTSDQLILLDDTSYGTNDSSIYLNAMGTSTDKPTCGKLLFTERVQLRDSIDSTVLTVGSFSTNFTFAITGRNYYYNSNGWLHGDGFGFVFFPDYSIVGSTGGTMCMIDSRTDGFASNNLFAVEFDTFQNPEYNDSSNNHVGVDVLSMTSTAFYNLCGAQLVNCSYFVNNGDFTAWIDYDGATQTLEVRLANGTTLNGVGRPSNPLIQVLYLDLSKVLNDYMYVGFSSSTGRFNEVHQIKSWSFASSGMPEIPKQVRKPSSKAALIAGIVTAAAVFVLVGLGLGRFWYQRGRSRGEQSQLKLERGMMEQYFLGPRQFTYRELSIATENFSDEKLLGSGGFGQVYKGILRDGFGSVVAVKRITHDSKQGEREFLAEISIISQIRHRNLVQLQGWCREKDKLLLVYEYMPNGSLDTWLFKKTGQKKPTVLAWDLRHSIVMGVAAAIAYLHEEWEQCVLHRDIKASNVMLDGDFNAHLGDFGLARLIDHDTNPKTTALAGTLGYLAPEMPHTGKATKKSDVYSFGVLALEVACGRHVFDRNLSDAEMVLIECVWRAFEDGTLLSAADPRLQSIFDANQLSCVLKLGLLCCHPDPDARPTMRLAHQCLIGEASVPSLPPSKPKVNYTLNPVMVRVDSSDSVRLELRVKEAPGESSGTSSFSTSLPSIQSHVDEGSVNREQSFDGYPFPH